MSTRTKRLIVPPALLMAGAIAILAADTGSGAKPRTEPVVASRPRTAEVARLGRSRPKRTVRHRARPARAMNPPATARASGSPAPRAQETTGPRTGPPAQHVAPPAPPVRQAAPTKPPAPPVSQPAIPQHNSGDMDADNNGGPSDGDGAQ